MDTSDHGLVMVDDRTNLASHFWSPLLELQRNRDMLEVAVWRHAIHWNIEKSGTLGEPPQFNCGNTMAGMESTEFNCKILRPQSLPKLRVSCFLRRLFINFLSFNDSFNRELWSSWLPPGRQSHGLRWLVSGRLREPLGPGSVLGFVFCI